MMNQFLELAKSVDIYTEKKSRGLLTEWLDEDGQQ